MKITSFVFVIAAGLPLSLYGQVAPIPADPLDLATSQIQIADTPASQAAALQLMARARNSYALKTSGHSYRLKVTFSVNSNGQTQFDGVWKMEDQFDPQQGLRWTAATPGYTITGISSKGKLYADATSDTIPLRLQEARAALFDPIPSAANPAREIVRTSTATFNNAQVTCSLVSGDRNGSEALTAPQGRRWEESEDCINPQSGLLQMHSSVPGRYYSYDYSHALKLGDRVLPRKITIKEAGQIVSQINIDSLQDLPSLDPALFVPTATMAANGRSTAMAGARKIVRFSGPGPFTPNTPVQPVIVFGLVTSSGKLVEAHSLQPSNPNSPAAIEAAQRINFTSLAPLGSAPQQHFVFIIEKFRN